MKLHILTVTLLAPRAPSAHDEEAGRKFFSEVHTALALKPGAAVAGLGSGDDSRLALSIRNAIQPTGESIKWRTRKAAATPPNAGADKSANPASTSASTRSGASIAALRQPECERDARYVQPEPDPSALLPFFSQIAGNRECSI
jgi:hypothetical protein